LRQINEPALAAMQVFRRYKQEQVMVRIAALLWAIGGTVFAGIGVMTVLAVPSLAGQAMSYIPYAALAGFIVAIPVAVIVARQIAKTGKTATR
jgi:MFS superfamily sulfate permease-like transporter